MIEDKFTLTKEHARNRNKELLREALEILYATHIEDGKVALYRGKAIQSINSMAECLGYSDIIRND